MNSAAAVLPDPEDGCLPEDLMLLYGELWMLSTESSQAQCGVGSVG
jgi:hypothetical protein